MKVVSLYVNPGSHGQKLPSFQYPSNNTPFMSDI